MDGTNYCFFNGEFIRYRDLFLHVSDLQFQRGYGVFDFFRSRNGTLQWIDDYLDRLYTSLSLSGIEAAINGEELHSIIGRLQQLNDIKNEGFKVVVSGGFSTTLDSVTGPSNFLVLHTPWTRPPAETFSEGVRLIKTHYQRPNPEIKTLYYFTSLQLQEKLNQHQAVDVLYHTNHISEASRANIFLVKDGIIYTPATGILNGITRKQVLGLLGNVRVEDIETRHLFEFEEAFLTSTSRDITPVISIEGRKIGNGNPGPVTRDVQAAFYASGW